MARAALKWSARDLSAAASIGYATVARFESDLQVSPESVRAMRSAIEKAGVELIENGAKSKGTGAGARLVKP